jgi:hypothetical protein
MQTNLLILFISAWGFCFGQSFSTSPLSYYGIGERSWQSQAIYSALGYSGISHVDSTQLNLENPASYSYLSQGNTLFSLGMGGKITQFSTNNEDVLRAQYLLDQYALGFKVKKNLGMVFSLRPYANRGYQVTDYAFTGVDSIRYSYIGKGGMSEFLWGMSYRPLNKKRVKFSVGANLGYAFGATEKIRRAQLLPSTADYPAGEQNTLMRLNNFSVYTSSLLEFTPMKNHKLTISAAFEPKSMVSRLRSVSSLANVSIGANGRPVYDVIIADTIDYAYTNESFTMGLAYAINLPKWRIQTRELHPTIKVLGTYRQNKSQILGYDTTRSQGWYGGIQFNPEKELFENLSVLKFAEKLSYRLGIYSVNNTFTNQDMSDFGTTFGIGIPILIQQSLSSINMSFQLGRRTNGTNSFIETYGGMQVGLIFCPSSFDRWFRKRKLD